MICVFILIVFALACMWQKQAAVEGDFAWYGNIPEKERPTLLGPYMYSTTTTL
jgi:hypothetical protein